MRGLCRTVATVVCLGFLLLHDCLLLRVWPGLELLVLAPVWPLKEIKPPIRAGASTTSSPAWQPDSSDRSTCPAHSRPSGNPDREHPLLRFELLGPRLRGDERQDKALTLANWRYGPARPGRRPIARSARGTASRTRSPARARGRMKPRRDRRRARRR